MLALTRELRQFETIFLGATTDPARFSARVFAMEEELPFAGHPALGAAAVLHEAFGGEDTLRVTLDFSEGAYPLQSDYIGPGRYRVRMEQGAPTFDAELSIQNMQPFLIALGLTEEQLHSDYPAAVVSTGLPYLIVPVSAEGLARAAISVTDLEERLGEVGAKFVYVFDPVALEGRTWDNLGRVEDIATGSAAGPAGAYVARYGRKVAALDETIVQGRFTGRPSEIGVHVDTARDGDPNVSVTGEVWMVGRGRFDASVLDFVR